MKKLSLILSVFMVTSLAANAYVDSQYLKSDKFLQNVGYSSETSKMLGITTDNPYRDVKKEEMTPANFFKRVYWYVNPAAQNDFDFYRDDAHFNGSSWKDM